MQATEVRARYKLDGKCPECGAQVREETQPWGRWQRTREFYIDCTKCNYSASGYERKSTEPKAVMWPKLNRPKKWIERETRPRIEMIKEEMDYAKQQAEWLIKEIEGIKHDKLENA